MRKVGYARVSTLDQNLDRQIEALKEAGCEFIFQEKISGVKIDRTELQRMLSELRECDIVIVKEMTRISRSTLDMLEIVNQIIDKGCYLKGLDSGEIDTTTAQGELILSILRSLAQFERRLLLERCSEGRKMAVKRGVVMGIPRKHNKQMDYAINLYKSNAMSIRKICEVTGVAKATLCRRLSELGLSGVTIKAL